MQLKVNKHYYLTRAQVLAITYQTITMLSFIIKNDENFEFI